MYANPSKIKGERSKNVPLITWGLAPDIRVEKTRITSQRKNTFLLEMGTLFNQIMGRMVFNSYEFLALYLTNSLNQESENFLKKYI